MMDNNKNKKMKEIRLIEKFNKIEKHIEAITNVLKKIIYDIGVVENLSQGTLSSFQLFIGKKEWDKLVKKLKAEQEKINKKNKKQKQEKKLEL